MMSLHPGHRRRLPIPALLVVIGALVSGLQACHRAPRTALDVLDRSVAAHGGEALVNWRTLTIRGRIDMQDGITYHAAYLLLAAAPGKLRVEHDLTKDRGRLFYEYFMNGGATWSRANLVVGTANARQLRRWFEQCFGVAQARRASGPGGLTLGADAVVEWRERQPGSSTWRPTDPRPVYVLSYTRDGEKIELFVDKETYYLLQETWPGGRRLYRDFKRFGKVVLPARVLEITKGRQGEVVTPISYESVAYDEPIEDWLFREDMPARAGAGANRTTGSGTR